MSTRESIVWGANMHFYRDLADEHEYDVHLRLDGVDYEASKNSIDITIPAYIWEAIRKCAGVPTDLMNMTDEQLLTKVGSEVDERIANYAKATNEKSKAFEAFFGSGIFGGADETKEIQMKNGFEFYAKQRALQTDIWEKMQTLRILTNQE